MEKNPTHDADVMVRRLAKILRDVLAGERFDTVADVVDALKYRCAALRIAWTPDAITEAVRLVASNHPGLQFGGGVLGSSPRRVGSGCSQHPGPTPADLSRTEAAALVADLRARCDKPNALRSMPTTSDRDHEARVRAQAAAFRAAEAAKPQKRRSLQERLAEIFSEFAR
jgi:hypothetical protein